mgnify:CR=1 FL=1
MRFHHDVGRLVLAGCLAVVLVGCDLPPPRAGSPTRTDGGSYVGRQIAGADVAGVRPIAEDVFRQYFRIDNEKSDACMLVSLPTEVTEGGSPQRVRDMIRDAHSRHRRLGELHLMQEGPNVVIRCRVQLQRLDTTERAAFQVQRGDDRPNTTAIDREGGATGRTREEWVTVGRDRTTERAVLEAIQKRLDGGAAGSRPD